MKHSSGNRANRLFDRLEEWANLIGVWFIILLMVLICSDVIYRNISGKSIIGAVELSAMAMAGIVALTLSYTQKAGEHVRLDLFIEKVHGKARDIVESVIILVCLIFSVLFLIMTIRNAINSISIMEIVEGASGLPLWPWKAIVPIGFLLLSLRLAVQLAQHLGSLRKSSIQVEVKETL